MKNLFLSVVVLTLSFQTGICAYCDQHTIPFSGIVRNRTRFYLDGESFLLTCDQGYRTAVTNGRFTCNKGVWSGHFPPCIPIDCVGPPPSIENAKIKSYSVQHLSIVVYECNEHYYPSTDNFKVQCLFGNWIGAPPVCRDSRCKLDHLSKNDGVYGASNFTPSGDRLQYFCNFGYKIAELKPLCRRGVWTEYGTPPCIENNCTTYEFQHGAFMEPKQKRVWKWDRLSLQRTEVFKQVTKGTQKFPGTVMYISCDNYYTFRGRGMNNDTTVCEKGFWKPDPQCK